MSHSVRKCSRCHEAEAHNCAYCVECKRIVQRERYRLLRDGTLQPKHRAKRRLHPDACNCGDSACNGLVCERAGVVA